MIPVIASRATASTKESVQQRLWAVDMTLSIAKRAIGGVGRFLLENVEASPGDPFFPKRGDQRFLVNDRAARDIDEIGGRLHQCETSRIQQMPRLLVEQARDDDKVRALHQLFEAAEFDADIGCGRRTDMGIGRQDCHAVGLHEASELAPNPAKADNSERPARQADAGIIRALAPTALASEPRFDWHAEAERQDESDG